VPFHHDPSHDDDTLDEMWEHVASTRPPFMLTPSREGDVIEVRGHSNAASA
jgi:hypothetical protein